MNSVLHNISGKVWTDLRVANDIARVSYCSLWAVERKKECVIYMY